MIDTTTDEEGADTVTVVTPVEKKDIRVEVTAEVDQVVEIIATIEDTRRVQDQVIETVSSRDNLFTRIIRVYLVSYNVS